MVQTLIRVPKDQRTVLLPGATEAEPWETWTTGPGAQCLQVGATPAENRVGRDAVLALPVAHVMALPLWLLETDTKRFREMIVLQLEARGLQPRGSGAIFDWSIVAQEEARTLVLVGILPPLLPEELETDAFPRFEVSARCLELPPDALVLWREHDRLVAAVARENRLAYFQALPDATPTVRVLQDLTCILSSLKMQGIVEQVRSVVLWFEATPAEVEQVRSHFRLPVHPETRPAPVLPAEPWAVVPARVFEAKRQRVNRRWWWRLGLLAGVLILVAALALGLRLFLAQRAIGQLEKWQADHAAALQMVQQTQAAWRDLQPVVARDSFPLEVLLHVSESLPEDQVHLTLFEAEGNHVLIKAEAKNLTAGFQFFDALKKNPKLPGYTWEMAQPQSLANDVTQLQIEGSHAAHD
jgi:hypothetical protein